MTAQIHPSARISKLADIELSVRGSKLIVEAGAQIDSFVKIKFAGGDGDIRIGENTYLNSCCVLYSGHGITIGDNVLVAANCTLASTNHEYKDRNKPIRLQGFRPSKGGIVIENDVWIGANSVILDGTHIANGCIVSAQSVVRGHLLEAGIYGGNPAQLIKKR